MSTEVNTASDTHVHQLVGDGSQAALAAAQLPCPETDFTAKADDGHIVAKIGARNYLIVSQDVPALKTSAPPWCFQRDDWVATLDGEHSIAVLAELCALDLNTFKSDAWIMARVAGIDAWLYRVANNDKRWLIGCDISYGDYMQTTLKSVTSTLFTGTQ